MNNGAIDPSLNYLLVEPDGSTLTLPGGGEFWRQLMSGSPTDAGIRQLLGSAHGRLVALLSMGADWTNWEMHPVGDEILFMLEGEATFVLDLPEGHRETVLGAGRLLVIPKGVWHTAKVSQASRLLAITAGSGTQHRAA